MNQPQAAVRRAASAGSGAVSASGLIRRVVPLARSKPAMSIASPCAWAESLPAAARFRLRHSKPGPVRTALLPAATVRAGEGGDPTGCGDVWGATYFSQLLGGATLSDAIVTAHRAAARNVEHRGATGLAAYLRGELSLR